MSVRKSQHSGMKSVPPRGSGWVRSVSLDLCVGDWLRTHPLPRGGTDFMPLC